MKKPLVLLLIIIFGISIYLLTKQKDVISKFPDNHKFKLATIDGEIDTNSFKDKAIVIFFGYMNCPDICPTALTDIQSAFKNLSKDEIKNTQVIFVSVDPSRDSLQDLSDYVKYFHPSFIGATSDEKTIKELTGRYYAYYSYEKQENSAIGYTVSHTTRMYVLNKNGKLVKTISSNKVDISLISNSIKDVLD